MLEDVLSKHTFEFLVEKTKKEEGLGYIATIIRIFEDRGLDIRDVGRVITKPIKDKIEAEGIALNMLPKHSSLSDFLDE